MEDRKLPIKANGKPQKKLKSEYFFVSFDEDIYIIHREYKKEVREFLDYRRTSIHYLQRKNLRVLH